MPDTKVTLKDIYESVEHLRQEIQENYVTKDEFVPVKAIAYGLIGTIGLTVLAAVLAQVVKAMGW